MRRDLAFPIHMADDSLRLSRWQWVKLAVGSVLLALALCVLAFGVLLLGAVR